MSSTDWIKTLAPMIGTALAGPLGGAAAAMLASKLGISENTVEAVSEVLNSNKMTSDQIAGIKLAEIDFEKFLQANKIKIEELDAADRASARAMQVAAGSWVPGALSVVITLGFFGILGWMLIDDTIKPSEPLLLMLGSLGTVFASVTGFYFGSSHGSRANQQALIERVSK